MAQMITEVSYISFRTKDNWITEDLIIFISSITEIYNVLLTYRILNKQEQKYLENFEKNLKEYEHIYEKYIYHPFYKDLLEVWREIFRDWQKRRKTRSFPPLPILVPFQLLQREEKLPRASDIFAKLNSYAEKSEKLQVYQIKMSSPGGFSFTGIGEVIKEFRELIKDIWFRNKQEKTLGQLEIIEKYLSMRREYPEFNLPPQSILGSDRKLIDIVNINLEKLKELEKSGKLESISENINYLPE